MKIMNNLIVQYSRLLKPTNLHTIFFQKVDLYEYANHTYTNVLSDGS